MQSDVASRAGRPIAERAKAKQAITDLVFEAFDRSEPIDLAGVPVVLSGPPFFVAVWRALRNVKRGHVRTYGGLARDVGSPRATRVVGTAMAMNPLPLVLPRHRVIADGSRLGGYADGRPRKIVKS